jgi:hypothetical protein
MTSAPPEGLMTDDAEITDEEIEAFQCNQVIVTGNKIEPDLYRAGEVPVST